MESAEYYEYPEEGDLDQRDWSGWGEIAVAPIFQGDAVDLPSALRFDAAEESLWAGTNGGVVVQSLCPDLERYSEVSAHHDGIIGMRSAGSSCVSLSPSQLSLHYTGCVPKLWYLDEIGDLAALEFEPRGHRVLLGRTGGGITNFDLVSGRVCGSIDTLGQGVVALCGPLSRGAVVMGTVNGKVALLDARNSLRQEASLQAHSGGFAALDASGDLIATAGYSGRLGHVSLEPTVKVFDVRMGLRMLSTLPFPAGPTLLRFRPGYSSTLLIGSASGMFTLTDAAGLGGGEIHCVDSGGDALVSCDISPSGECLAFGGAGGYLHLWAASDEPSASIGGEIPSTPELSEVSPPSISEDDPFGTLPQYFPPDNSGFASDIGTRETMAVGLPPRILDPTLLASSKQTDFVAHIENPLVVRGGRPGQSTAAVAALRNTRIKPRPGLENAEETRAARAAVRAAAGGIMLPGRYRRVAIKQQTGVKFEEFDFSYYNKTPFSGLENDLANCYVNALLQVLFYCRPMRDLAMTHTPDPDVEFSLMGELSLLFRMLATAGGMVCQAANLLRALRQNKEALALGLLEGVRGERGSTDIEVEAQKDKSLARRAQRLSRFLMEQLSKETSGSPGGNSSLKHGGAAHQRQQQQKDHPQQHGNQQRSAVEDIFAVMQCQRTLCLSRQRPDQEKSTRAFQVDLQYPPAKNRPALVPSVSSTPSMASFSAAAAAAAAAAAGGEGQAQGQGLNCSSGSAASARHSFSDLLASSLHTVSEMRAWFDEAVSYQMVRQERCPVQLPQVLIVNAGLEDRGDLGWWQPVPVASSENTGTTSASGAGPGLGAAPSFGNYNPQRQRQQGPNQGRTKAWMPMSIAITVNPLTWSVEVVEGSTTSEVMGKLGGGDVPEGAVRAVYEMTALIAHVVDEDEAAEGGSDYEGHLLAHINVPRTYYSAQQESPMASRPSSTGLQQVQQEGDRNGAATAMGGGGALLGGGVGNVSEGCSPPHSPLPGASKGAGAGAEVSGSTGLGLDEPPATPPGAVLPPVPAPGVAGGSSTSYAGRGWLLFNDFSIAPCLPQEVTEIYGGQKIPVLLFFTRVEELTLAAVEPPVSPTPVLTTDGFLRLCRAPPIQPNKSRLHRPTFVPLSPEELPRPGQLFALDAEFVQYSPPERVVRRGVEVQARPPRLGLGRVSVIRGEGSTPGVTCIDDYIRSVEPVYDYLTRFSGLVPGDLDPGQSRHHLTTLRRAYLKLRYLVDVGVIFVGHGLKKDFRMLNIVVPPEQVVDTVDLFHSGRRRLSLRFLAAYLLGATIQGGSHDSVEDAVAALKLYETYVKLVEDGKFDSTLGEMYEWGNAHGWDPTAWGAAPPHLTAQAQAQAQAQVKQQEAVAVAARQVQQLKALQHQLLQQQQRQQLAAALQQQLHTQQQRPPGARSAWPPP